MIVSSQTQNTIITIIYILIYKSKIVLNQGLKNWTTGFIIFKRCYLF